MSSNPNSERSTDSIPSSALVSAGSEESRSLKSERPNSLKSTSSVPAGESAEMEVSSVAGESTVNPEDSEIF